MMADDYTGGEIKRGFDRLEKGLADLTLEVRDRHHNLSNQVTAATGPISAICYRLDHAEADIKEVDKRLERLDQCAEDGKMQSVRIYAVVGALVIVGNVLMWAVTTFWRH